MLPTGFWAGSRYRSWAWSARPEPDRFQVRRRRKLLFVSIHFYEAILGAELDAGSVCLLTVLPHDPTVQELRADIERSIGVPDQVGSSVRAMVVRDKRGRRRLGEVGIVYRCVRIDRAGPKSFLPVVLIGCFDTHGGSCLERSG